MNYLDDVMEALKNADRPLTTTEITRMSLARDPRGQMCSRRARVFTYLRRLYMDGVVDREIIKGSAYWSLRGQEA